MVLILIHAIAKIIAKVLAIHLSPHMHALVSNTQSAFIKTRSIHANFMYVRNIARRLHKRKTPSLLLKLDIRKAFDSVQCEYIIGLLQKSGFPDKFRNWTTTLICTSSSRVLLNGVAFPSLSNASCFHFLVVPKSIFQSSTNMLTRPLVKSKQDIANVGIASAKAFIKISSTTLDRSFSIHPWMRAHIQSFK